jgi:hypothetical protein
MITHRNELRVAILVSAMALLVIAFYSPVGADLVPFRDTSLAAKGSADYDESNDSSLVPKGRRGGGARRMSAPPRMAAPRVAPRRVAPSRPAATRVAAPRSTPPRPSAVRPVPLRPAIDRSTQRTTLPSKPTVLRPPRRTPPAPTVTAQQPPVAGVVRRGHSSGPSGTLAGHKPTGGAIRTPTGFARSGTTSTTSRQTLGADFTPQKPSSVHTTGKPVRGVVAGTPSKPTATGRPVITAHTSGQPQVTATSPTKPGTQKPPAPVKGNVAGTKTSKPPATGKPVPGGQKPGKERLASATPGTRPGEPIKRNLAQTTRTPQGDKKPQPGQQGGKQTTDSAAINQIVKNFNTNHPWSGGYNQLSAQTALERAIKQVEGEYRSRGQILEPGRAQQIARELERLHNPRNPGWNDAWEKFSGVNFASNHPGKPTGPTSTTGISATGITAPTVKPPGGPPSSTVKPPVSAPGQQPTTSQTSGTGPAHTSSAPQTGLQSGLPHSGHQNLPQTSPPVLASAPPVVSPGSTPPTTQTAGPNTGTGGGSTGHTAVAQPPGRTEIQNCHDYTVAAIRRLNPNLDTSELPQNGTVTVKDLRDHLVRNGYICENFDSIWIRNGTVEVNSGDVVVRGERHSGVGIGGGRIDHFLEVSQQKVGATHGRIFGSLEEARSVKDAPRGAGAHEHTQEYWLDHHTGTATDTKVQIWRRQ